MAILTMGPSDDSWGAKAPKDGIYVNSVGHRAQFWRGDVMAPDYVPAPDVHESELAVFDAPEEQNDGKSVRSRETGTAKRSRETAD